MEVYEHTQVLADTTWTVTHNFGTDAVAVDVFIDYTGSLQKVLPLDIVATDNNTLTITFTSNQTGIARVVGTPGAV